MNFEDFEELNEDQDLFNENEFDFEEDIDDTIDFDDEF
jgi:hypothetical protein